MTMFRFAVLGDIDYGEIHDQGWLAQVMFVLFGIFVVLLAVNYSIANMSNAYTRIVEEATTNIRLHRCTLTNDKLVYNQATTAKTLDLHRCTLTDDKLVYNQATTAKTLEAESGPRWKRVLTLDIRKKADDELSTIKEDVHKLLKLQRSMENRLEAHMRNASMHTG